MRLSLIQMTSRTAARDENVERACNFIFRAAADGANLIVLPKFFNCEYFPQYRDYRYMDYAESDTSPTTQRIRAQAKGLKSGSFPQSLSWSDPAFITTPRR
jgi:predicted amidohydrolase